MLRWTIALFTTLLLVTSASAQTMTAQEKKNLDLVLDWWRVLVSGHGELVPQYIAPDVKQHNPNFAQGAAAISALLASRPKVEPMPEKLTPAQMPILTLSQGDIVVLI